LRSFADGALFTTWGGDRVLPVAWLDPGGGGRRFASFRNAASAPSEAGFYNGASARLGGMLAFAKVA
jgi:hypothetical protein